MTELINSQLKKWRAGIVETGAGSDRTTDMTGPLYGVRRRWPLIACILTLALAAPGASFAAERGSNALILPSLETALNTDYAVKPDPAAPILPALEADWGPGFKKSYLIPALEIPSFLWLLNRFDRTVTAPISTARTGTPAGTTSSMAPGRWTMTPSL